MVTVFRYEYNSILVCGNMVPGLWDSFGRGFVIEAPSPVLPTGRNQSVVQLLGVNFGIVEI